MRQAVKKLVAEAGTALQVTDTRPGPESHRFACTADLGVDQATATDVLVQHELGMLVAPPGAGRFCLAVGRVGLEPTTEGL